MTAKPKLTSSEKNLIRRYLVWCYKTTKEDLDRIDRYFTQNVVDEFLLKQLRKDKMLRSDKADKAYRDLLDEFEKYKDKKMGAALSKKFSDKAKKKLAPQYRYGRNRVTAIEKAIRHFFGDKELKKIVGLYEEEMMRRILEAREHA